MMKTFMRKRELAICFAFLSGLACQQKESVDQRVLPQHVVSGSFLVEAVPLDGDKKSILRSLIQPIAYESGCNLEGPNEILWESYRGALPSTLTHSYHVRFLSCQLGPEETDNILSQILNLSEVQSAEAEAVLKTSLVENDPYLSRQYYHKNIKRNEACDLESSAGKPVVVAVVDSGVQKDHPDLVGRFYRDDQGQVVGANFAGRGSRNSPDNRWGDVNGHGTHVAGLIAATSNNGAGISGVASCKNVLIMPVRVMGSNGTGSSIEIDRGIQWAAAKGADIINLSLGSNAYSYTRKSQHRKSLYENLAKQGVIVFAASGNDGFRNGSKTRNGYIYSYPASYDHVIAVGATDQLDRITDFSVYGERIDIAAPGQNTISTYPRSSYKYLSGTSMATPIAAGAYALALSQIRQVGNEFLYHDDVMKILQETASRKGTFSSDEIITAGVIDTKATVQAMRDKFPLSDNDVQPPSNPLEPVPDEPEVPSVMPEGHFRFVGLAEGDLVNSNGLQIKVAGWPEGTYRIYLYWLNGNEWYPRSFTNLGREHLTSSGVVATEYSYILRGNKYLVAEAVDYYGRRLGTHKIRMIGL